jgi:hypothetical protein
MKMITTENGSATVMAPSLSLQITRHLRRIQPSR